MPPIWPQEAPSSEKLAPQPSKECSDRLLLRVQEGEVDCGFHGSLAAQVGGKPFAQRHLGEGGWEKGEWSRDVPTTLYLRLLLPTIPGALKLNSQWLHQSKQKPNNPPKWSSRTDSIIQTAFSKNQKTILTRANGHEVVFWSRVVSRSPILAPFSSLPWHFYPPSMAACDSEISIIKVT